MSLSRPKLVHITTVPQSLSFFTGQIGYMRMQGFEVHAISSPGVLLTKFAAQEGIAVHAVEMLRRITPYQDLLGIYKLWALLRHIKPQIVHAHTPKGGLLGMLSAYIARVPVRIYHIHGFPFMTATGFKQKLLRWSERIACTLAHQVFTVSHGMREVAITERICSGKKLKVLLNGTINGIDAQGKFNPDSLPPNIRTQTRSMYNIPSDALVVGFVGRIVRDKGIIELATAWQTLRKEFPTLHLLIAGEFEPQDSVPADVISILETDPRVHLVGHVDTPEAVFAASDVVALPTYREGISLVPLEAAAMERPTVATRIPGCMESVQDGITGVLVPPYDAQSLADALKMYLNDAVVREKHGRAGRMRVLRDFQQASMWDALFQEYIRLLQSRQLPPPIVGTHQAAGLDSEI